MYCTSRSSATLERSVARQRSTLRGARCFNTLPCPVKLIVVPLCGAVQIGAAQIESALNSAAPICPVQHAQICTARRELVRRWNGRRCYSGDRCAMPQRTARCRAVPRRAAQLWRGATPHRAEPRHAGADKRGVAQYGVYQPGFIVVAGRSAAWRGTLS